MVIRGANTLIKSDELPKFNGKKIKSIYTCYHNSRYTGSKGSRGYEANILFYKCYVDDYEGSVILLKELPDDFKELFGYVENKGDKIFVNHFWFRMSGSGNGGFIDGSIYVRGWASNSTSNSFILYRDVPCYNGKKGEDSKQVIDVNSKLGKKLLSVLNKEYDVDEVTIHDIDWNVLQEGTLDFASLYPYDHTPIQIYDGMVYPDEKLSSWRWLHGMPYRVPDNALEAPVKDFVYPKDRKCLRVWDADNKCHLYLERADEVQAGDTNLITVSFEYKNHELYGSEGNAYCRIRRYRNNEYAKYEIRKVYKGKDISHPVEYFEVKNGEKIGKYELTSHGAFYRIVKIVNSNEDL